MIRKASKSDMPSVAALAQLLWEDSDFNDLLKNFLTINDDDDSAVFVDFKDEKMTAFAQCQLRYDYVEGTGSSPVGYLEGIFVKEEYRKQGIAGALLHECEKWAKSKGCSEFASDCELTNTQSLDFHLAVGFSEANRIICFTKKL